jgi:hypothetical protein
MKNSIYTLIFITGLMFFACEEECSIPDDLVDKEYYNQEIFNDAFINIYGNWELTDVTGGIHGSGHELNFDLLQIRMFGVYSFIQGGNVLEYGKILIDEQTNDYLKITFSPDEDSEVFFFDSEKEIIFPTSDNLILQSPCCDRYNYHLDRE